MSSSLSVCGSLSSWALMLSAIHCFSFYLSFLYLPFFLPLDLLLFSPAHN